MNRDLIRWGHFDDLERELFTDFANPALGERAAGQWLLVFSLRNQGRLREARDLIEDGQLPGLSKRLEGIPRDVTGLAIIALEQGQPREAAAIFRKIAEDNRTADLPAGFKARVMSWQLTLSATALAEAGDTAEVRRLANEVEQTGQGSIFGRDAKLHHFLRGLIYQQAGQHDQAVLAFQRSLFSLTDGYTRTNLYMSRSLLHSGRPAEAIAILQPALRGGVDGSNTYVTHTALHEAVAEAFTRAGMPDSAVVHYRAVERAWRQADPIFRERYERAKARSRLPN
jgi:tetratricopeptide (TPR) repeat protein